MLKQYTTSVLIEPMLRKLYYLQKGHHDIVNIGFHKTDVQLMMLKTYFLVV